MWYYAQLFLNVAYPVIKDARIFRQRIVQAIYDHSFAKGTSLRVKPMVRLYIYEMFSPRY
uniref:Uncharacterized protein n=1 Tax=Anguilla anguilla TaxID=7936 RepID=A0A0E9UY16_ANGAN